MQEGIGRGGYRVLAIVFYIIGVLALAGTLYAFLRPQNDMFNGAMMSLSFVSLTVIFVLTLIVLRQRSEPAPVPTPKMSTFTPAPITPPPAADPAKDIGFEADGPAEVGEVRPFGKPLPEAPGKREIRFGVPEPPPRAPVVPKPNTAIGRDSKGWPGRTGPSGITRGEWKRQQDEARRVPAQATPDDDDEEIVVEALVLPLQPKSGRPTKPATPPSAGIPVRDPQRTKLAPRAQIAVNKENVVEARLAFKNTVVPAGMARGRCGSCDAKLLAPTERPIHLRCPGCGKVNRLD